MDTLLLEDLEICGNVRSSQSIVLKGKIEGNLFSEHLVIVHKHAEVIGNVQCRNIELNGIVRGDISVADQANLGEGAEVDGHLTAARLRMHVSAVVKKGFNFSKNK